VTHCFFVSDLHGDIERYEKFFGAIRTQKPDMVFIGGDILPSQHTYLKTIDISHRDFVNDYLVANLNRLRDILRDDYPRIFIILGNDDGRFEESTLLDVSTQSIWEYAHNRKIRYNDWVVYGYSFIPPTPFHLKDWERYDVSRYVDPGCIPPEDGVHTTPVSENEVRYSTIKEDLKRLTDDDDLKNAVFLFHSPPYKTNLDRAGLDGVVVDHAPVDVHIGSIAIKQFIESKQPLLTLHGHVHESARLTGSWRDRIGRTHMFSAAHSGPELSLVKFELEDLESAKRELI